MKRAIALLIMATAAATTACEVSASKRPIPSAAASSAHAAVVSTKSPAMALGSPQALVCPRVVVASDLSGLADTSAAVVEGNSTGATSVLPDGMGAQFHITKVLAAVPGVDPSGTIEVLSGAPHSGFYLPSGSYLLFLEFNPIVKIYVIANGVQGGFRINGETAASLCPEAPPTPAASADASAPILVTPLGLSELESFVTQLHLGQILSRTTANSRSPFPTPPASPTSR